MAELFNGGIGVSNPLGWSDRPSSGWTKQIGDQTPLEEGSATKNQPTGSHPKAGTGALFGNFSQDWYDRIHVSPLNINLGNITSGQTRELYVWNAFLNLSKTLNSITVDGDDTGVTLVEPDATPSLYVPLELKAFTFEFETNGPATINLTYSFNFADSTVRTVDIDGRRAILFAFTPDWSDTVTETLEWLTNIIEVENGLEYRQHLRANPRRIFEYSIGFSEADKRKLEQYMYAWKARPFIVPLWPECQTLGATVPAGTLTINVDTQNRSYIVGGLVALMDDPLNNEVVEIASLTASSITLSAVTTKSWSATTRIVPALSSQMPKIAGLSRKTAGLTTGTVRFNCIGNMKTDAVDSATTHQGLTVLEDQPDMGEDQEIGWESKWEVLDTGPNDPVYDLNADLNDPTESFRFYIKGHAEIWRWREWLHAREGRYSQYYMPSWSRDFIVADTIADTSTVIEVIDNQYRTFYDLAPTRRDVMIVTKQDGTFYRRLTSSAESVTPGQESLGIDTALGVTLTPDDIILMSFLVPSRFESDSVQFEWQTGDQAILSFTTRGVEQ